LIKKISRKIPVVVWMGFIFFLSAQHRIAVSQSYWLSFLFFKTLHLIEYGILFLLWDLALYPRPRRWREAFAAAAIWGLFDEIHQHFVPTRHGCLRDVFIDALGIFLSWQLALNFFRRQLKKWRLLI